MDDYTHYISQNFLGDPAFIYFIDKNTLLFLFLPKERACALLMRLGLLFPLPLPREHSSEPEISSERVMPIYEVRNALQALLMLGFASLNQPRRDYFFIFWHLTGHDITACNYSTSADPLPMQSVISRTDAMGTSTTGSLSVVGHEPVWIYLLQYVVQHGLQNLGYYSARSIA